MLTELKKPSFQSRARWVVAVLVIILSIKHLNYNLIFHNERHNFYTYFYAKDILRSIQSPAILFSAGDTPLSSIIYLQQIENFRKDVILMYPAESEWFINQFKNRYPEILENIEREKGIQLAQKIAVSNQSKFNIYSTHAFIFPDSQHTGLIYTQSLLNKKLSEERLRVLLTRFLFFQKHPFPQHTDPFIQEIFMQYPWIIPRMDWNLSNKK